MSEYIVHLTATATVSQFQCVKANSKEEAERKAKANVNNEVWRYVEADDSQVEVASVTERG